MARANTNDSVDINFDGLTDSVTNLVGAIILLVVILVGVTKHAVQELPATEVLDPSSSGQVPVDDLLEQTVLMQAQLKAANQQVVAVARQVADIKKQFAPVENGITGAESVE